MHASSAALASPARLDALANDVMTNALRASGKTSDLISEDLEEAAFYIDALVNVGTIFGIYETAKEPKGTIADVLSRGSQTVATDLNVVKPQLFTSRRTSYVADSLLSYHRLRSHQVEATSPMDDFV
ncbi:hypothetical protein BV25DRAFT_1921190 [Artomyces pyxidatus]|uniref:Uncharacterized protein n=1 Tax=Artomyces pyxidatus TaxID=48021 RepID=A0ACB8SIB5_9AGAM|nr:hypothetical protein BV25DRAFT_1921190 [Artomyces pyxidatus]